MQFENERTYEKLVERGREDEFHSRYETAYDEVLGMLGKRYPNLVGGEQRFSKDGEFPDICPYDTNLTVGRFQNGTHLDVIDAVKLSMSAQPSWEQTKVDRRCAIFRAASDEIRKDKYNYCAWLTLENGKNRFEAMAEMDEAIDYLRYYPKVLQDHEGYALELDGPVPCNESRSVLRPLGIIGVISPFNFPIAITTGMVTGALVTGNAVILKPPSDAPLMGHMLHKSLVRNGVPPEAFHYITGPGDKVGSEIVKDRNISAIAFTGSRDIGMGIAKASAENGKRPPILEMGGKNPAIVSDKADLVKAVEGVGRAAFGYMGQKCSATSRVIVNRAVADEFIRRLALWVKDKKIGNPSNREVFAGPVINGAAVERFKKTVVEASKAGQVLAGGHVLEGGVHAKGYFVEPTIIVHLASNHELAMKELFLPILVVLTYGDLDEAVTIANKVEYGLTAGMFSDDPAEVEEFFSKIRAGVTYANRSQGATTGALVGSQPFTGWKSSGVTGKGAGGPYYLLQFLQEQSRTVCK
jgi:1-pyrroline-5-carboxylate dehydrogenase